MLRLVQLIHPAQGRRLAVVDEPKLRLVTDYPTVLAIAQAAIEAGRTIQSLLGSASADLDYDSVYEGKADWLLLPPFDHPTEPSRCFITGTGLTHKASADNRQAMHGDAAQLTDSMKMYRIGLEGGRPAEGQIGAAPEWFYKGTGRTLRAQNQALDVPNYGFDGGEEAEIGGCYLIGPDGTPYRVGMAQANEFSDHILEAQNYLYLAHSKLRSCSLGPELVVDADFSDVKGTAMIRRGDQTVWTSSLASGESAMSHALTNLEHHHFKYAEHRRPGDAHIHFFGADMFSFKDRLKLLDGDVMEIRFNDFGRALRNPLRIDPSEPTLVRVKPL